MLCTQVNNSSTTNFWNNLRLTWQKRANLPEKQYVSSITELDGKVYITTYNKLGGSQTPYMYNTNKDQWSILKSPSWHFSLVSVPDRNELLAIGVIEKHNDVKKVSKGVFLWDRKKGKWLTPYPDMPTARCHSSSISHQSSVIVAGGVTNWDPVSITRSVEVLHITDAYSHWSVVEQLPFATFLAIPLIVNDNLYIAAGYDEDHQSTCNVVTASLPQLLRSSTSSGQVWNKLPDMPYSSFSFNHYQGRLITFNGDDKVEQPDKHRPTFKLVPLIHIYNVESKCWDCVGKNPHEYYFRYSVLLKGNEILFVGGLTGGHNLDNKEDAVATCMLLTLSPHLTLIGEHY